MADLSSQAQSQPKPKKKIQRLRTGCWTCRRRGYKCDEGKPYCKNCTRLNIKCEGYGIRLKWQEDRMSSPRKMKKSAAAAAAAASSSAPISSIYTQVANTAQTASSNRRTAIKIEDIPSPTSAPLSTPPMSRFENTFASVVSTPVTTPTLLSSPSVTAPPPPPSFSADYSSASPFDPNFVYSPGWNPSPNTPDYVPNDIVLVTQQAVAVPIPSIAALPSTTVASPLPLAPSTPLAAPSSSLSKFMHGAAEIEDQLVQHFCDVMAVEYSAFDPHPGVTNVLRDVISPQHVHSLGLRYAICGLSARHMSQLYPEYISMSVEYKVDALKALRESLRSHAFDMPSLSCIIILAMHEVYESNFDIWKKHVQGAVRGAIAGGSASLLSKSEQPNERNLKLLMNLLEYHDTMCALLGDAPPMLGAYYRPRSMLPSTDDTDSDTAFMSSVETLFRIVSAVATLAHDANKTVKPADLEGPNLKSLPTAFAVADYSKWSAELNESRVELQIQLSMWTPAQGMTSDLYNTSQLIKVAADLYFCLRLDSNEFGVELSSNLRALAAEGLQYLQQVSLQSQTNMLHSWPLWQVGVVCENIEDQQIVLSRLEQLKWKTNKISLQTIIDFLRLFWYLRRDANYSAYTHRELLAVTAQRSLPVIFY